MRTAKELLIASKAFAHEKRWLSWWHLLSTLAVLAGLFAVAISPLPWGLRLVSSLLLGLVEIRLFVIYHDYQHGAILRHAPLVGPILSLFGWIVLNPRSVWNRSHDHHHKNNSKIVVPNVGSYPIMTTHGFGQATYLQRAVYLAARHPCTMVLGYLTVFLWGMCLRPLARSPRRHLDAALAIAVHGGLLAYLLTRGIDAAVFGLVLPMGVASSLGAYLFYAQHNFPEARLRQRAEWSHVDAALRASSYIAMGPVMNWFTGNIGFHHVHHLNARIPFYRLPEAMRALEELQSPGTTRLQPAAMVACLRLKLWDPEQDQLVAVPARSTAT